MNLKLAKYLGVTHDEYPDVILCRFEFQEPINRELCYRVVSRVIRVFGLACANRQRLIILDVGRY